LIAVLKIDKEEHKKLGAKFMKFGGWKMLVQYASIIDENNVVRTKILNEEGSHTQKTIL
jgi:glycine cleavage system aminomethyltransferase T